MAAINCSFFLYCKVKAKFDATKKKFKQNILFIMPFYQLTSLNLSVTVNNTLRNKRDDYEIAICTAWQFSTLKRL